MKKGISLIVLVITIIVIIILAGSVILSLANNNPIAQANQATFKADVDAYNSELSMAITSKYIANTSFNPDTLNAGTWNGTGSTLGTIKEYIPSMTTTDAKKFEIQNGKLVYVGDIAEEKTYMTDMGLTTKVAVGLNIIAVKSGTVTGSFAAYNNPVIPMGFKTVNTTDASWNNISTDWNKGLVIEDAVGNQFVWVPVDGTNVTYTKNMTFPSISGATSTNVFDDALPSGVNSEVKQVTKYGGFYIARYEAGLEGPSTIVSKQNAVVWASIGYDSAKITAESMYNNVGVKSGLVTGTEWDATMKWIENSGKSILDSTTWGNHSDSAAPANVTGYNSTQVAGFSEYWKSNNIYDLAGNVWEFVSELHDSNVLIRGGDNCNSGISRPASVRRGDFDHIGGHHHVGFRVALYVI